MIVTIKVPGVLLSEEGNDFEKKGLDANDDHFVIRDVYLNTLYIEGYYDIDTLYNGNKACNVELSSGKWTIVLSAEEFSKKLKEATNFVFQ